MMQEWSNIVEAWVGGRNSFRSSFHLRCRFCSSTRPFDGTSSPSPDIGTRRAINRLPPTLSEPSFDLGITSRRERKAPRKLTTLLHLMDSTVGERMR
jgi:hypothetical protein